MGDVPVGWECQGRGRSGSSPYPRLRCPSTPSSQENQKLRDQNEDLNGQILSLTLNEAKNLFATQTKAQSLAAEIDNASRDEVSGCSGGRFERV